MQRLGVLFAHLTPPCQPSPEGPPGRPAHRHFRGLLGVHSRCSLHTRAVTVNRDTLTRGFSHFVTSMTAPIASGGSESPGGPCTHWKAPPWHGARPKPASTVRNSVSRPLSTAFGKGSERVRGTLKPCRAVWKTLTGGLSGCRLNSARRDSHAARPRSHCRIRPAARKGRIRRREVKDSILTHDDGANHAASGRCRGWSWRKSELMH